MFNTKPRTHLSSTKLILLGAVITVATTVMFGCFDEYTINEPTKTTIATGCQCAGDSTKTSETDKSNVDTARKVASSVTNYTNATSNATRKVTCSKVKTTSVCVETIEGVDTFRYFYAPDGCLISIDHVTLPTYSLVFNKPQIVSEKYAMPDTSYNSLDSFTVVDTAGVHLGYRQLFVYSGNVKLNSLQQDCQETIFKGTYYIGDSIAATQGTFTTCPGFGVVKSSDFVDLWLLDSTH